MKINFKGIKNAGAYSHVQKKDLYVSQDGKDFTKFPQGRYSVINFELNNNESNDLDEFREILQKYPNHFNSNTLNIEIRELNDENKPIIALNQNQIKMNRENLKTYAKVFKLLDKISKTPNEDLKVENSYVNSFLAMSGLGFFTLFSKSLESFIKIVDKAHYPEPVKNISEHASKLFEKELVDYLNN